MQLMKFQGFLFIYFTQFFKKLTRKLTQISNKKKIIAIIMCGGEGTRMKRYYKTEKPLLKIKDKKIIEYVIEAIIITQTNFILSSIVETKIIIPII